MAAQGFEAELLVFMLSTTPDLIDGVGEALRQRGKNSREGKKIETESERFGHLT